jgi:hypothetical protein
MRSAFLLAFLGWLVTGTARDARAAEPDPKVKHETIRLMGEGKAAFSAGRFEDARQAYESACALMRTSRCLHSLALAELKAGKPLDAYKHFREELVEANDLEPRAIEVARRMKDEAFAATGHIVVRAPEDSEITIDGAAIDRPLDANPIDVLAGPHRIETRSGMATAHADVVAAAGEVVTVDVHLEPPSSKPGAGSPAAVSASLAAPAAAPPAPTPMSAERVAGSERPAWWSTRRALGVGAIGVGAVSLGLAEVFHLQAQRAKDKSTSIAAHLSPTACGGASPANSCSELNDELSTQDRDGALGMTFLIAGIVGMAVGAGLVLWPDAPSSRQATLALAASAHGGWFELRGEF